MMYTSSVMGLAAAFFTTSAGAAFTLAQNYQGQSFFDAWTFLSGVDGNSSSNVLYQTREQALQKGLVSVNAAGHAIIKMDNITDGTKDPTFGRASVYILSNATVSAGSLVIMDATAMPFGCSVWPAFWMQGQVWPADGEIDIAENVNLETNNQYSLHTAQGCMHPSAEQTNATLETGTLISTDCFNETNYNQGCLVEDPSPNSFGAGFRSTGGGAFATLWDDAGFKIWFFPRASIPADLSTDSPNPSAWSTPTTSYPTSACDTNKFFGPQSIIFNINVCGSYPESNFNPSCPGKCQDFVGVPSNYDNAYFEISYLRVFTGSSSNNNSAVAASTTSSDPASTPKTNRSGRSIIPMVLSSACVALTAVILTIIGG